MASSILDAVLFNPTAGSTTDWAYSSAVTGYQSPAAAGAVNGTIYFYRAYSSDLTQWEEGLGAWNSGTGVLARTTVLFNSAGNTSKINFTNPPFVAIVVPTSLLQDASSLFTTGVVPSARLGSGVVGAGLKYLADDQTFKTVVTPKAADQQVFTSSGTWTKPSGFSAKAYVLIECWGAGGGAARGSTVSQIPAGGGGGYADFWILLSSLASTESVTVGAGGLGRTGSTGDGGDGGNSSFGAWLRAYAGQGGKSPGPSQSAGKGGGLLDAFSTSGSATTREDGGGGATATAPAGKGYGGGGGGGTNTNTAGGSSVFGSAGATAVAGTPTKPGFSGGGAASTSANTNGGDGGDGKVVVTVFDGA